MASTTAAVAAAANGASSFHARSISLPSRSHPLSVRVEEGLHKLKTWATSELLLNQDGRASSAATELLCPGLQALQEMHECVEELLRLPRTQRALARRQHEKWAAVELDSSVRLLDVCQSTRDAVSSIKEQAQRLQSALRRTRRVVGDQYYSMDGQLQYAFVQSRKKAHKEGSKCSKALKQLMERQHVAGPVPDDEVDGDLSVALKAMENLREITVIVLRSTACFLCNKPSRKWFPAASCPSTDQFEKVDASLRSIFRRKQYYSVGKTTAESFEKKVEEARRGLQSLEVGMGGLEMCLDSMFRRLIQNRVSLLNILSP